jgi:histidine kinase
MIALIRQKLGIKLFIAFLSVILIGAVVLVITIQLTTPTAFFRHMGGMEMGMGMGQGAGQGGGQVLYNEFRSGVNEALGIAALAAIIVAVGVSLALSRRIIAPLQVLSNASQRIAEGKYDERVSVGGVDELGQLAESFNQMAERLEQVENMRRQLIGDVSHELRTPLTAIKGSMEGLMDGVLPADEETYQQIRSEADRLSRLVDDLQELSRVEAHAYQLEIKDVDLSALVLSTIKRLTPNARRRGVSLISRQVGEKLLIPGDEDRLGQVLTNLVANGIQYTPERGEVVVSLERKNGDVQVAVSDNGIGIPPEHLTDIFTRFYRVDKSRSRAAGGGSGIGLTIARLLVEAHGGRIWAESKGEGKGSRFIFTLPAKR